MGAFGALAPRFFCCRHFAIMFKIYVLFYIMVLIEHYNTTFIIGNNRKAPPLSICKQKGVFRLRFF